MPMVTVYNAETGEPVERWPVDARELLASGGWVATPPGRPDSAADSGTDLALIAGITPVAVEALAAAGITSIPALLEKSFAGLDEVAGLDDTERISLESFIQQSRNRVALNPKPTPLELTPPKRRPGRPKTRTEG